MSIASLLRATATRVGDGVALYLEDGDTTSYARLDSEVDRVAAGLQRLGISKGDRVAIGLHNSPLFPSAYFAILRIGAVAVPLNVMLTEPEVARVLADSGSRILLTAPPFEPVAAAAAGSTAVVERVLTPDNWDELGPLGERPDEPEIAPDDLAVLAYTSGTTGEPKGAMLTHGNLVANLHQQMQVPDAKVLEDDVLFLALPLFHIFGLNVTLGLMVMNGASGVLMERFDPIPALELIQKYKVSVLFGAPTMYQAWVDTPGADQYDLSSVRLAISGAAPLSEEVLSSFRGMFGVEIYEGYGLTETAPTLTSNRMAGSPRPGSIGMPLPEVEMRLVDEEDNEVEFGDPGEIVVRGPNVFKGYWNRKDATRAAFRDGWFHTGDVAVQDEEGYLYLVDRKRDLIIVSGFNVFPSEVELALVANPKVKHAAVVGVAHPYTGEAVKAYVVLQPGEQTTQEELIDDVHSRLARFKSPQSVDIVDELPLLVTGKVLRRALRT